MSLFKNFFKLFLLTLIFFTSNALSDTLKNIKITGNDRISDETIKLFISKDINEDIDYNDLNKILKDLYETNFFKDVKINLKNQSLFINVVENPIIENIYYTGIKSNRILDIIKDGTSIKSRSSFITILRSVSAVLSSS